MAPVTPPDTSGSFGRQDGRRKPSPQLFHGVPPEFIADTAELAELFVSLQIDRGRTEVEAAALAAKLPESLLNARCFLNRMTDQWNYYYGRAAKVGIREIYGGGLSWHPLTELIDSVVWAHDRFTPVQLQCILKKLRDPLYHAEMLFEFAPVLRIDPSTVAEYEVADEAVGNRRIDWKLTRSDGKVCLLEVKLRSKDLLQYFRHIGRPDYQATDPIPDLDHNTDILFRSVESKFPSRASETVVQGVWVGTKLKQVISELEASFRRLDPTKVHFAILGGWSDMVFLLTQEGVDRAGILQLLHVRETDSLTFERD